MFSYDCNAILKMFNYIYLILKILKVFFSDSNNYNKPLFVSHMITVLHR